MSAEMFDEDYWAQVNARLGEPTCINCGHPIIPLWDSSTSYTHTGTWEGIRCEGRLCGATAGFRSNEPGTRQTQEDGHG